MAISLPGGVGVVSRVQEDSSVRIGWGNWPYVHVRINFCAALRCSLVFVRYRWMAHLNNSLLSLHSNLDLILGQHDIQIPALQIPRHRDRNFDVADGLGPFVGELGLFGVFASLAVFFFLFAGGGFGGGGGFFVSHYCLGMDG